jgi:hypothetical protein
MAIERYPVTGDDDYIYVCITMGEKDESDDVPYPLIWFQYADDARQLTQTGWTKWPPPSGGTGRIPIDATNNKYWSLWLSNLAILGEYEIAVEFYHYSSSDGWNYIAGGKTDAGAKGNDEIPLIPQVYALHQNNPNPFNITTTIRYDLPEMSDVKVDIFNLQGRRVATLVDEVQVAGYKQLSWTGKNKSDIDLPSGVYVCRLQSQGLETGETFVRSNKMVLVK